MHRSIRAEISTERVLVWAFLKEKACLWDGDVGIDATGRWPQDSCVKIERLDLLGRIDATSPGARAVAKDTAHDAEIVAEAVMSLEPALRMLVYSHAKAGNRPDWRPYAHHRWERAGRYCLDTGEVVPVHLRVDHMNRENWTRRKETCRRTGRRKWSAAPTWCPVREIDAPAVVASYRARWLDWAFAVHGLRDALVGRLGRWTLTHELPVLRPWQ